MTLDVATLSCSDKLLSLGILVLDSRTLTDFVYRYALLEKILEKKYCLKVIIKNYSF